MSGLVTGYLSKAATAPPGLWRQRVAPSCQQVNGDLELSCYITHSPRLALGLVIEFLFVKARGDVVQRYQRWEKEVI